MINSKLLRCALLGLLCLASTDGLSAQSSPPNQIKSLSDLSGSLESLAQRVAQATVQIFAVRYTPPSSEAGAAGGLLVEQRSTGSGTLVSSDGYIVTNTHVVSNARSVHVVTASPVEQEEGLRSILRPARQRIAAKIIGTDRETDLAVLKITGENLSFLELGDSDELQQGQLVMAFGSPLGLQNSVSLGVVSSVARQLRQDDPMIYIQTDAAINPGNSGGPLVDMTGRLVGVNTFILSQSGGNEGLGFSAPSNIVRHVYNQIRENGRVKRGRLDLSVQSVTPELAEGLGLVQSQGVIVSDVKPGGAASLSGIKVGDLILTLDGKVMENARQLEVNVYARPPGATMGLNLQRGSQTLLVLTRVIEREDQLEQFAGMVTRDQNLVPQLGILGLDVDAEVAKLLPLSRKLGGVAVVALAIDARFRPEGFLPGDVIYQLNGENVTGLAGLKKRMSSIQEGEAVVIQVQRQAALRYIAFRME